MKHARFLFGLAFVLLAGSVASAQEFWDKKPYTEWSKKECKKLLEDSPWTQHFGTRNVEFVALGQSTDGTGRQSEQKIDYYAQIRSALPVRMAVVRLAQIENKYDEMTPAQKKVFDQSVEAYLNADYSRTIVVHIEYGSNVQYFEMALARVWQGVPEQSVPVSVYLIGPRGQRIMPIRYKADQGGGRSFSLTFPRFHNGEPLVTPNDKHIRLELPNPSIRDLEAFRAFFEWKVEKMKFKGALVY